MEQRGNHSIHTLRDSCYCFVYNSKSSCFNNNADMGTRRYLPAVHNASTTTPPLSTSTNSCPSSLQSPRTTLHHPQHPAISISLCMFADAFVTSSIVWGVRDEKRREERGKSRRLALRKVRVYALPTDRKANRGSCVYLRVDDAWRRKAMNAKRRRDCSST